MFTRESLDRCMFERGWEPVTTAQPEFINYRRISYFGENNYSIVSLCLAPNILEQYESAADFYQQMIFTVQMDNP